MRPIADLHRTRGRFGSEAQANASVLSGMTGRWTPVIAGVVTCIVAGALIARARRCR